MSSFPCVEIAKAIATDAFRADPSIAHPLARTVANIPGVLHVSAGLESQDPQYLYLVVVWETLKHHQDLMASPEYSELQAKVTPSATILESMKHVTFNTEPYTALKSPLAEFAIWTLYESTDKQKFQEKLEKLVDLVINLPPPAKVYKGGWGPVVENDRQFVVLLGWESLESFNSNIAASPQEVRDLIAELKGLADLDLKHVSLHLGPQN